MNNVLPLVRPPAEPGPETRLYRRIRLGSRVLVVLFSVLASAFALALAALLVAALVYRGEALRIGPTGVWVEASKPWQPGTIAISALPFAQRLVYVFLGAARAAPSIAILVGLRRLFDLYARGVVFARENARQIRLVGLWLVIDAVVPYAEHVIQHALNYEIDHDWFHVVSLQELVLGALVFVVAEVMRVGHEIEQEREAFV